MSGKVWMFHSSVRVLGRFGSLVTADNLCHVDALLVRRRVGFQHEAESS